MFVQTNSVKSIKNYFRTKLSERFSESEIKLIESEVVSLRLGMESKSLIGLDDQLLSESDLLYFRSVVKRLLNDEPFQYIVGNAHFYGLILDCDRRALIPRPETEELVDWIKESLPISFHGTVLDLCTGSGCIALAIKSVFPESSVGATDFSRETLSLAKQNAQKMGLNVQFYEFDAKDENAYQLELGEKKFDCWVSNPPYIPENEMCSMDVNVLEYEPHLALFVENDDPLIFYGKIAGMALKYLNSKGFLFFELHENFADQVALLAADLGFINVEIKEDLQGKKRMLKAEKL